MSWLKKDKPFSLSLILINESIEERREWLFVFPARNQSNQIKMFDWFVEEARQWKCAKKPIKFIHFSSRFSGRKKSWIEFVGACRASAWFAACSSSIRSIDCFLQSVTNQLPQRRTALPFIPAPLKEQTPILFFFRKEWVELFVQKWVMPLAVLNKPFLPSFPLLKKK